MVHYSPVGADESLPFTTRPVVDNSEKPSRVRSVGCSRVGKNLHPARHLLLKIRVYQRTELYIGARKSN